MTDHRLVPSAEELGRLVVGRHRSFLAEDLVVAREALEEALAGKRVLVVGGAGSIGASTVRALAPFAPAELHVVDQDENGLAEVIRDLRSAKRLPESSHLATTPVDAGSTTMARMLAELPAYDFVLNFAAVKHVRSERDVYSVLRMLDINIRLPHALLKSTGGSAQRYFAVSTDKAANPVSLMGASKRAMEHVLLGAETPCAVTTARFANVAFSQGSLLAGWLFRLAKNQPLAVPEDTRRWFVTLDEAGELCLLAALLANDRRITIPDLDPRTELHDLVDVAERTLAALGLKPFVCRDEDEARDAIHRRKPNEWPMLITRRDTAGEKEEEEFFAETDELFPTRFSKLTELKVPQASADAVTPLLSSIDELLRNQTVKTSASALTELLAGVVPEFRHQASGLSLDARM